MIVTAVIKRSPYCKVS